MFHVIFTIACLLNRFSFIVIRCFSIFHFLHALLHKYEVKGKKNPASVAKFYEDVQVEFIKRKNEGRVMLAGDWNARFGKNQVLNRWVDPFVLGNFRNFLRSRPFFFVFSLNYMGASKSFSSSEKNRTTISRV